MIAKETAPAADVSARHVLDTKQAAAYLNVTPSTLETWRYKGGGPKYLKLNRAVRYRAEDLEDFIATSVRANTSEVA